MRARDISHALNYIDDDLIKEAADFDVRVKRRARATVIRIGTIAAAAIALFIGGVILLNHAGSTSSAPTMRHREDTAQATAAGDGGERVASVEGVDGYFEDGGDEEDYMYSTTLAEDSLDGGNLVVVPVAPGETAAEETEPEAAQTVGAEETTVPEEGELDGGVPGNGGSDGGQAPSVTAPYEFVFDSVTYVTVFEEADLSRNEDLVGLGQADSGEDIYACSEGENTVLIDIDGVLYIAEMKV